MSLIKAGLLSEISERRVTWASEVMYRVSFTQLQSCLTRPSEPPISITHLVLSTLPLLNAQHLLSTKGVHANKENPLEDIWQKELYSILTSLVPVSYNVSASVGRIFSTSNTASQGLVDFYIDDKLQWMLEFVSEGSDLAGHLNRFKKNGEYMFIPRKSWLIVDFRSIQKDIRIKDKNILFVSYADDFSVLTVSGKPLQAAIKKDNCIITLATKETLPQTMATLAISKSKLSTSTRKIKKRHTEVQMDDTKPDKRKRSIGYNKEKEEISKSKSSQSSEEEKKNSNKSDE